MAETFEADEATYHASQGVSNSQLKEFIDDPLLYWHYHVAKDWPRPPATPAMQFGTEIHRILPPLGESSLAVIPRTALNADGHRKGKQWTDFAAANAGKLLVKESEAEPYQEIIKAAAEHPLAWALSEAEHAEVNIRWTDAATGLLLRSRLDRLHINRGLIVDIKTTTTTTEQEFANEVARYGYHRQAAFYQQAAFELTGDVLPFVFCAVRKSRPYTIRFYDLAQSFLDRGEEEIDAALRRLKACYESGQWAPASYGEIQTLSEPKWLTYSEAWSL